MTDRELENMAIDERNLRLDEWLDNYHPDLEDDEDWNLWLELADDARMGK